MPVIIGFCIAFILWPVVEFFEDKVFFKLKQTGKAKLIAATRGLSILCSLVVILSAIVFFVAIIIPQVKDAVEEMGKTLPGIIESSQIWVKELMQTLGVEINFEAFTLTTDAIKKMVDTVWDFLQQESVGQVVDGVVGFTAGLVGIIIDFFLSLIIAIYILSQREAIGRFFTRFARATTGEKITGRTQEVIAISSQSFRNFIIGQLTEAGIIGCLCLVGMLVLQFPYAASVSTVVGITALIPVFGAWFGGLFGAILMLSVSPTQALLFILFIIVLQQLEGNLIYPKVMGASIGLPNILVFVSVVLGGSVMGVTGMLLGVPICSVAYTLLKQHMDKKLGKEEAVAEATVTQKPKKPAPKSKKRK